jgi:hypothetical protein
MKLNESGLPAMYSKGLFEVKNYDLAPEHTDKIFTILFEGTSEALKSIKSKDHPVAFKFNRLNGDMVAAAIVQYFKNDDSSKPDNLSLVWTFYPEDIPANAYVIDLNNVQTHPFFKSIGFNKYHLKFDHNSMENMFVFLLETLYDFLDQNAKEGEEFELTLDSVFTARSTINNGKKEFSIEPAGEVKVLIKDDASNEK